MTTTTTTTAAATATTKDQETTTTIKGTLQKWYRLLVTKEDYMHHHKILGILCLLSFMIRFICNIIDPNCDMLFHTHPQYTIPTILLHICLSVSSFQFRIPIRRIQDGGRIWPQYRYHSIIFSMRSILILVLYYYEDVNNITEPLYYMNYIIIMCVIGCAEYINYMVGPEQRSNTVRELDGSPYVKFFFSTMQLFSMTIFLFGHVRYYSIPYYALYTIQVTPFIGTLRRKLIFTSNIGGTIIYGSMLIGGLVVQTYYHHTEQLNLFVRCCGCIAALLRFTSILPKSLYMIQNKFVIYTVLFSIMQYYRSTNYTIFDIVHLRITFGILIVLLCLTAYQKVQSGYYPKDVKHAKQQQLLQQTQNSFNETKSKSV